MTHLLTAQLYLCEFIHQSLEIKAHRQIKFSSSGPNSLWNYPFLAKNALYYFKKILFQIDLTGLSSCQQVVRYTNHLMHLLAAPLLIRGYRHSSALLVFFKDATSPRGVERSCHESTALCGFMFTGNSLQSLHLALIEILHAQSQHCIKGERAREKTKLPIKTKPKVSFFIVALLVLPPSIVALIFLPAYFCDKHTECKAKNEKKKKKISFLPSTCFEGVCLYKQ